MTPPWCLLGVCAGESRQAWVGRELAVLQQRVAWAGLWFCGGPLSCLSLLPRCEPVWLAAAQRLLPQCVPPPSSRTALPCPPPSRPGSQIDKNKLLVAELSQYLPDNRAGLTPGVVKVGGWGQQTAAALLVTAASCCGSSLACLQQPHQI